MGKTQYVNLSGINELQTNIMVFVISWVHEKKTPVPQKKIILKMTKEFGITDNTTIYALNALLSKGYIRRAFTITNTTAYVQLRSL